MAQKYVEEYYEEFRGAAEIENNLSIVLKFIDELAFDKKSYWFNKANIFSLICELYKYDLNQVDNVKFKEALINYENIYKSYTIDEFDFHILDENGPIELVDRIFAEKDIKYFEYAREAVNEKSAREYRGAIINEFIVESLKSS